MSDEARTSTEAEAAFAEVMEHIRKVEAAAREWGIRPDHLEGRFVSAMATALAGLGRIAVAASKDALAVTSVAKAAADSEAERMRSSVAMVDTQLRRIDTEIRRAEIHRKDLETKTVASLTKEVAAKLETVLVIRERRWNRQHRHLSHGAVAAAALAIMLGGYIWRGVQDNGAHATAIAAWEKCLDTAFVDKASGKPFCQIELTKLPPPSQRLLAQ